MSATIFLRKRISIRTIRKFLLCSLSHDPNLHVRNPSLNRVARHECLSSVAHNYKPFENSYFKEKPELGVDSKVSPVMTVDQALQEINFNVQRTGRVYRKQIEEIFSLMVDLGGLPTATQSLYLLRSCGLVRKDYPQERVKLADQIWKKLQDLGCQFDISHYNALLKVYVDNNHVFSPPDFLTSLESNKIEPNRVTFLFLMQKYCNDGDLNGATEVLEFMKEKGLAINENVFNILITGHINAGDASGAKDVFDAMRSANVSPTRQSYIALASGYAKKGDISAVKSVLQDMQSSFSRVFCDNYLAILSSLESDEHTAFVDEVIGLMEENIFEWRQGVINTVLDLVNKNLCESAFKLVLAICNSSENSNYPTNIFLHQLIKTEQPVEKIMHYCNEIHSKGINNLALINTLKCAAESGNFGHTMAIFERMSKMGVALRSYHFLNILSSKKSDTEILSTLENMFKLGVPVDFTTYLNYIFPAISVDNPEDVFEKIQETGHGAAGIIDPLFHFYCYQGKSDKALRLMKAYTVNVQSEFDMKSFITTHSDHFKGSPNSCFQEVLSFVMEKISTPVKNSDVNFGTALADLILLSPAAFQRWIKSSNFQNCQIMDQMLDVCYNILAKRDPKMLIHLRKLEYSLRDNNKVPQKPLTIEEEDTEINLLKEKGVQVELFVQQLLSNHLKEKNFSRVRQLKDELENLGFVCSPILCCQLIHFARQQNDVEMAVKYYKTLKTNYPNFIMDSSHALDYATMLVQYSRYEEAIDTIKTECKEPQMHMGREFLMRTIKILLDAAIDTGNVDLVRNIQDSLQGLSDKLQFPKLFLEPLIKMHIFRNDLDAAIEEFKSINKYKNVTPLLPLLLKKCIVADDHVKLETVIDIASATEGKIPVLHELVVAFFETNRTPQAVKILENLGPKVDSAFLHEVATRLYRDQKALELREFLFMIGDLKHVDQAKLFFHLFKLYDLRNEHIKALDLYETIEKSSLFTVDVPIKSLLRKMLLRNNIEIPSALTVLENEKVILPETDTGYTTMRHDSNGANFHSLLGKGYAADALEQLNTMKKGLIRNLPLYDVTQLIDLCVKQDLLKNLTDNVQTMSYIIEYPNDVLVPLYKKYADAGDVESMHRLAGFIPDFTLKKGSFNSFLCKAYLTSGKGEDLLTLMESRIDQKNKIYSSTAFIQLMSFPHLKERVIQLAKKYMETKFDVPIAAVWAHYVITENFDAANELEKQYFIPFDKMDGVILREIRDQKSLTIARKYVNSINKLNTKPRYKERGYAVFLDILVVKRMYAEAAELVVEAKKKNVDESHFRSTLIILKTALERENMDVPFVIPAPQSFFSA